VKPQSLGGPPNNHDTASPADKHHPSAAERIVPTPAAAERGSAGAERHKTESRAPSAERRTGKAESREPSAESAIPTRIPSGQRLWGGRFGAGPAEALDRLNRSLDVDFRLWPHDIRLSKAWAGALWSAGVLTLEESARMEQGLDRVAARIAEGVTPEAGDEDIHTLIDRLLREELGDLGARLHTGRSRNDQVATATRLWTMDAVTQLDAAVRGLQHALLVQAESLGEAIMPAYTHVQQAQPVLASHWLLSHFWPLERDRRRLAAAGRSAAVLPLGSGAVAGSAFPVPRVLLKETLGFSALSENSVDAVADRDFVAETLFALAMLGTHLSRLAEDLIMFGSSEFGFVKFGERFTTGSSMMPQKRNPDALELARGSAARTLGDLVALLATLKGLPSGYNKDLQDDKRALFGAADLILLALPAVSGALAECTFDTARMRAAVLPATLATDLADALVRRGVAFRDAHAAVGRLVRQAEEEGVGLDRLPASAYTAAHPAFGDDALSALSHEASVAARGVEGGTAPAAVRAQLEAARAALEPVVAASGNRITPLSVPRVGLG
jgi:argininosuccinate lyase